MAGFLEKDKRLIDYKLTEFGRDKLSLGSLDLKYYTFSDSSIVYNEDYESLKSFKVSDISSYLPFEVDVNVNNIINPEYTLSSVISFDQLDNNILFINKESNRTTSDYLIDLKLLDNKVLKSENDNREINFDFKDEKDEFDFHQKPSSYPTIKSYKTLLSNIDYVKNDKRFIDKTRNKFMPPTVSSGGSLFLNEDIFLDRPFEIIFKSLNIDDEIPQFTNKEDFVIDIINKISTDSNIHRLEYIFNEEKMLDEDVYLFEMHKKVTSTDNVVNLSKLSFVHLGEFYDSKEYNFKNIYLIGKVFLTRNLKEEINEENKRYYFNLNNDYSFVNMFTLVVE
jgi:hypothetical protein